MATTSSEPTVAPPKRGRPPRINRSVIAAAANELGLEGLTLKGVADHLGVSVAALYHYVSGKDELLRIAAEESTRAIPLPVDHGQNWAQWLFEWAEYNRAVFSSQPGLLAQYLEGAIEPEVMVRTLDDILAVLVREGFSVENANRAFQLVVSCALGTVVGSMWERSVSDHDGDLVSRYRDILKQAPRSQLTYVRKLARKNMQRATFPERNETVLRGIAAENGLRWKPLRPAATR
jgi:AcrR family transcriptional regulator